MASGSLKRLRVRAIAAQRLAMCRLLSRSLPLYIVTEFPKSGGSWVSQMLAEYLGIPFPRNQAPPWRSCVMHGHYLHRPSLHNVLCVLRDGRDVAVSAYYHYLIPSDRASAVGEDYLVPRHRAALGFSDHADIEANLPAFIEYLHEYMQRGRFRFTWSAFVHSWVPASVPMVRYEDLLGDPVGALVPAIEALTGQQVDRDRLDRVQERYAFARLTGRRPGQEDTGSFLRKGVAGDWRGKFSAEARRVFDRLEGDALIAAGYEADRSWVEVPRATVAGEH